MGALKLYSPHAKQLEIHQALDRDDIMYCVVPTGRQFGKTLLGINQSIKWGVENHGWNIIWVSPTYKQCKKVFRQMLKGLNDCPFVSNLNRSDLIVEFDTGSQIIFYSAEAYDTIRGESADAYILDEFRFYPKDAYQEGIKPSLAVKGKKVLIISTTKGKGKFHELYQHGVSNRPRYISFSATTYDNPYVNIEEIKDAEETLPDFIYRQEYLGEFIDDGSTVFRNIKECIDETAKKTQNSYAGIDLGRVDDWTVITIVNELNEEIYSERWRHLPWSSIINNLVGVLNKFKPHTLVEANGAQDAIYEQIRNKVSFSKSRVQPFVTTSKSKQAIVEDLIVEFEGETLGIIGHDWQIAELEVFSYEYNIKTRNLKYEAPSGFHDDYVMSRCIANHAKKTMKKTGRYHIS